MELQSHLKGYLMFFRWYGFLKGSNSIRVSNHAHLNSYLILSGCTVHQRCGVTTQSHLNSHFIFFCWSVYLKGLMLQTKVALTVLFSYCFMRRIKSLKPSWDTNLILCGIKDLELSYVLGWVMSQNKQDIVEVSHKSYHIGLSKYFPPVVT